MLSIQYQKVNKNPTTEEIRQNVHSKVTQWDWRVGVSAVEKTQFFLLETKLDSRFPSRSAEKTGMNIQVLSQFL